MDQRQFSEAYRRDMPNLEAWGGFVNEAVLRRLRQDLGGEKELGTFLKLPAVPRLKDLDSMIAKAFYRGKQYTDPYVDITDKVGVRYVVLLREEIKQVAAIIEANTTWAHSKDRDFEEEKLKNPLTFDYQSLHYVVRNKEELSAGGIVIPIGTPCEIQIRTLLQHAYAELTHDTTYKPKTSATAHVQRLVAKGMALIETTDDIFERVKEVLRDEDLKLRSYIARLEEAYRSIAIPESRDKLNLFILDAYSEMLKDVDVSVVDHFAEGNTVVGEIITKRREKSLLYRQPVVLLMMYLIVNRRSDARRYWPLTDSELRPLFADLGVAFEA